MIYKKRIRSGVTMVTWYVLLTLLACGPTLEAAPPPDTNISSSAIDKLSTSRIAAAFSLPVLDGVEGPLTFVGATIEANRLIVHMDAAFEGIEPLGDPILVTAEGEKVGEKVIHGNNNLDLIFDNTDQIAGKVILPRVSVSRKVDLETRLGDDSFVLPDDVQASFSLTELVSATDEIRLRYSTAIPSSTSISLATISGGGVTIQAKGYSAAYSASGEVLNPSIIFPAKAKPLLDDANTVVKVLQVRQMVRFEISL